MEQLEKKILCEPLEGTRFFNERAYLFGTTCKFTATNKYLVLQGKQYQWRKRKEDAKLPLFIVSMT